MQRLLHVLIVKKKKSHKKRHFKEIDKQTQLQGQINFIDAFITCACTVRPGVQLNSSVLLSVFCHLETREAFTAVCTEVWIVTFKT